MDTSRREIPLGNHAKWDCQISLPDRTVAFEKEKVMHALATVGATHLKDRPPYRLSGGEKRSAAIATALSTSPNILVMDEPTSNLDPKTRRQLIELLKTFEHTIIVATHDMDMVLDLCPRTLVLKDGKIEADGPTLPILQNGKILEACGLEKPFRLQGCPICNK